MPGDQVNVDVLAYQVQQLTKQVSKLNHIVETIERARAVEVAAKQPINNIVTYILTQGSDLLFKIGFLMIAGWLAVGGGGK